MQTIASAALDTKVTMRGTIEKLKLVYTKKRRALVIGTFTDLEGSTAEVIWFNQPHIKRMLSDGDEVVLTGKLIENGYKLQFQAPAFEQSGSTGPLVHSGRLVPIYPQHDFISTRWLREKITLLEPAIEFIEETLPKEIVEEEELMSRKDAIRAFHFPDDPQEV